MSNSILHQSASEVIESFQLPLQPHLPPLRQFPSPRESQLVSEVRERDNLLDAIAQAIEGGPNFFADLLKVQDNGLYKSVLALREDRDGYKLAQENQAKTIASLLGKLNNLHRKLTLALDGIKVPDGPLEQRLRSAFTGNWPDDLPPVSEVNGETGTDWKAEHDRVHADWIEEHDQHEKCSLRITRVEDAIREAHVATGCGSGKGDPLLLMQDIVATAQEDAKALQGLQDFNAKMLKDLHNVLDFARISRGEESERTVQERVNEAVASLVDERAARTITLWDLERILALVDKKSHNDKHPMSQRVDEAHRRAIRAAEFLIAVQNAGKKLNPDATKPTKPTTTDTIP